MQASPPYSNLIYDSVRRQVLFVDCNIDGTHWAWTGASWQQQRPTNAPPPRQTHAVAFDRGRGRVVMFGGAAVQPLQDTWEYDGTNWQQVAAVNPPPAGNIYRMIYDTARARIVLGSAPSVGSSGANGLWTFDGTTWASLTTSRNLERVIYDAARQRYILVQDTTLGLRIRESSDAINYTTLEPPTGSPRPHNRHSYGAVAIHGTDDVLVFGGDWAFQIGTTPPANSTLGDCWLWTGSAWNELTGQLPDARNSPTVGFDENRGQVLLTGGSGLWLPDGTFRSPTGTWLWQGGAWTQQTPDSADLNLARNSLVFDPQIRRLVQFTNRGDTNGTIRVEASIWDGNVWTQQNADGPSYRENHAAAYHDAAGHAVVFGGQNPADGSMRAGTWLWSGSTWSVSTATEPPPREMHSMAYDSTRQEIVLFGGYDGTQELNDTWVWTGSQWLQRAPITSPSPRLLSPMCYDSVRQRIVLATVQPTLRDTWEWDGANWLQRSFATTPSVLEGAAMAYDVRRQRSVLRGTVTGPNLGYQTWEWDGIDWRQLPVPFTPEDTGPLAYDPDRRAIAYRSYRTWLLTDTVAAIVPYGTGCAGFIGEPDLDIDLPYVGSTDMSARIGAFPGTFVGLHVSIAPANISLPGGCTLLVQQPPALDFLGIVPLNSVYVVRLGLPPNIDPALLGLDVYMQAGALDTVAPQLGIALSRGYHLTIGN